MYIHNITRYKDVYDKYKNLKLAAEGLGMKYNLFGMIKPYPKG